MSDSRSFQEVVSSPEELMGVKAVFGALTGRAMCFGSRGDAQLKDRGHFRSARISAEYAVERPMLVTIGGGGECGPDWKAGCLTSPR